MSELFKVVDLDDKAICYFKTEVEAEKFIRDLGLDKFRIEEVNQEKKINELRKRIKYLDGLRKRIKSLVNYYIYLLDWTEKDK